MRIVRVEIECACGWKFTDWSIPGMTLSQLRELLGGHQCDRLT